MRLLEYVWLAYDSVCAGVLSRISVALADEDLERSITELLEAEIHSRMTGEEPFLVQHGPYEHETRKPAPAQPPQYDIAFRLRQNPRIMWPLEAKVLRSPNVVGPYVEDVRQEFLTCRYAPFSCEGAMLGYLAEGDPLLAFSAIAAGVPCVLRHVAHFGGRPHRASDHVRMVPAGKPYPASFRCHHLILTLCPKPKVPLTPPPQ